MRKLNFNSKSQLKGSAGTISMIRIGFFVLFILLIVGCGSSGHILVVEYLDPLPGNQKVIVLQENEVPPEDAVFIGPVKQRYGGLFRKADPQKTVEQIKKDALFYGGNVLHLKPADNGAIGKAQRFGADVFYSESYKGIKEFTPEDTVNQPVLDSTNSAILHVKCAQRRKFKYDLFLGHDFLTSTRPQPKEIFISTKGYNILWARLGRIAEIPCHIEFGEHYYLLCDVIPGLFSIPTLELVTQEEWENFNPFQRRRK